MFSWCVRSDQSFCVVFCCLCCHRVALIPWMISYTLLSWCWGWSVLSICCLPVEYSCSNTDSLFTEANLNLFFESEWNSSDSSRKHVFMVFYTPPHSSGGVLWFHVGCPCVCPSVRLFVRLYFVSDDNLSKYQWIFTKLGMCIDIMEIWFGIANGQILSIFMELSARDKPYFRFRMITWVNNKGF